MLFLLYISSVKFWKDSPVVISQRWRSITHATVRWNNGFFRAANKEADAERTKTEWTGAARRKSVRHKLWKSWKTGPRTKDDRPVVAQSPLLTPTLRTLWFNCPVPRVGIWSGATRKAEESGPAAFSSVALWAAADLTVLLWWRHSIVFCNLTAFNWINLRVRRHYCTGLFQLYVSALHNLMGPQKGRKWSLFIVCKGIHSVHCWLL